MNYVLDKRETVENSSQILKLTFLCVDIYFYSFPFWRKVKRETWLIKEITVLLKFYLCHVYLIYATVNRSWSVFFYQDRTFRVRDYSRRSFWFPKLPREFPGARGSLLRQESTERNCTAEGALAISDSGTEHGTWLSVLPDQLADNRRLYVYVCAIQVSQ